MTAPPPLHRAIEIAGWGLVCSAGLCAEEASQNVIKSRAPGPGRPQSALMFEGAAFKAYSVPLVTDPSERMLEFLERAYTDALNASGMTDRDLEKAWIFGGTTGHSIGPEYIANMRRIAEGSDPLPNEGQDEGPGLTLRKFCERHGLGSKGHVTLTTACTSGAVGLIAAARMIERGDCDVALVAGYEVLLGVTISGFQNLLLYEDAQCRPFSADRSGILAGEGAGVLILRRARHPSSTRRRRWIGFCGGKLSSSSASPASADTSGTGVLAVMEGALAAAGLAPRDIAGVKVHGTGTVDNDLSEGRALSAMFCDSVPPLVALKSSIGHALGACGALETALFCACLERGYLPPSPHLHQVDLEMGPLRVSPLSSAVEAPEGNYLLNFFGFGGSFCSLVLEVMDETKARQALLPDKDARVITGAQGPAPSELFRSPVVVVAAGGVSSGLGTPVRREQSGAPFPPGWDDVPDLASDIQTDPDTAPIDALLPPELLRQLRRSGRYIKMCAAGAHALIQQFEKSDLNRMRIGLFLCSGLGNQDEVRIVANQCFSSRGQVVSAFRFLNSVANIPLFTVAQALQVKGMQITVSQQRGAVEEALHLAELSLCGGEIDLALIGGCDVLIRPYKWLPLRNNIQPQELLWLEQEGRLFGEGSHWLALSTAEVARERLVRCGPFVPFDAALQKAAMGFKTDVYPTALLESFCRAYLREREGVVSLERFEGECPG